MQDLKLPAFISLSLLACGAPAPAPSTADAAAPPVTPATRPEPPPQPSTPPTCANGTQPAADGLIDDFEGAVGKPPALGGRSQSWWVAAAERASVTKPGKTFAASPGGPPGSKQAVHFAGKTAHEDAWGAAVAVNFLPSGFYDASKYAGIAFKIRSEKPNFNVRLKIPDVNSHPEGEKCKKECWNSFGKELIVGPTWQDVTLMWSELTQQPDWGDVRPPLITPSQIRDVEWTVYPGQEFDFWVDDIHFLACK